LIVKGELPVSKEEAATLAGIQLHLEETWPDTTMRCGSEYKPSETGFNAMDMKKGKKDKLLSRRQGKMAETRCGCLTKKRPGLAGYLPPYYTMSSSVLKMIEVRQLVSL